MASMAEIIGGWCLCIAWVVISHMVVGDFTAECLSIAVDNALLPD